MEQTVIGTTERLIQTLGFPIVVCIYFMVRDWKVGKRQASALEKIAQTLSILNRKEFSSEE